MNILDCINRIKMSADVGLISTVESFGTVCGKEKYMVIQNGGTVLYEHSTDSIRLKTTVCEAKTGVFIRKDYFDNMTGEPLEIYRLANRFYMNGSEYDIYTRYNAWRHESLGMRKPLVTQVRAATTGSGGFGDKQYIMKPRRGLACFDFWI